MKLFLALLFLIPSLSFGYAGFKVPEFRIGADSGSSNIDFTANLTGFPKIRYNYSTSKWTYSHDGTTFNTFVSLAYVDAADTVLSGLITTNTTDIAARVIGQSASVDSEIALFSGTGGKTIKRATGTGFVKVTSGVMGTPSAAVDLTSEVTGTLPVNKGGTGAATLTANNVIIGNGTSAVSLVAPGTSGNVLTSNGTTWTSTANTAASTLSYSVQFGASADCSTNCTTGSCTICSQTGTSITSVTYVSAGSYRLNGLNGTKYVCTCNGYNGGGVYPFFTNHLSSTSSYVNIEDNTTNTSYTSCTCVGVP